MCIFIFCHLVMLWKLLVRMLFIFVVIVRELFYNQPVRRKQMQSSRRRELHHVKKCVLRVALIHPQVSLRLLDIESEDELLYTIPSSSPLPLISNSFGNNVSSCLHEIASSYQHLALSGHISRPMDVFCNKDFQYLYINSRFVSKSPMHNMLNNLAASFQSFVRSEEIDVQSRKRQKNDVYPAYLLNLCCPRSSYDLHFEPSQTIVEFKDWQTVMSFFEQTITNYWKKHVPQPPEVKAINDNTCVHLKRDVKSNEDFLKHHDVQKKEDVTDLYRTSLQKNTDQIPWKSNNDARLSYDISPEKSSTGCHLNIPSTQMADGGKLIEDILNQHSFGCSQRSKLSKGRYRSHSAPPFYRGKIKFSRLNESMTRLTADGGKDITVNNSEDITIAPEYVSHMNSTQPIPETCSNEFPNLNFSLKGNVKMCEDKCSDDLDGSTAIDQISKWRYDSDQHTVLELQHGPFECYDDVLSVSSGPLHLSCNVLVPECIDKNCFEEAKVLSQLDKKFIPIISGEALLLVDQHAADERIRLEELRRKVLSDDGRGITYLDSEEDLALPETGFQLFQKYIHQIQKWGWIINNSNNSSESFKKNMNILKRQSRLVTLAAVPCILGVNLTGKDLMDFIQQLDETDGSSAVPPAVIRILNFKACRGAIMFGDPLLPSECSLIIEELKATSLCFQCAHGRPTTVPIVNIASLREEVEKLEMVSRRQAETWHGLSHHGPSLERARTRLKELRRRRCGL
ncbi:hypothetical protein GUJ93_ZPchr0002g25748 [Zizania palustris]|uniref:MutL C-terminal dimerisation domain-containing protein n=1 Tax=Zizania palustris TaxID=103762 RepID=A0A8J5VVA4_ZIZPA|nr:hypothetical protein GUJ93_ZPchr0002g25748 [Zizania palustris]